MESETPETLFGTVSSSTSTPVTASSPISLKDMPMMLFEKFLITPFTENLTNKDRRRVEIPIFFGAPMVILREKHEVELSQGRSFIEAEPPPKHVIINLRDRILMNCSTVEDIETVLGRVKPVVIYHLIIAMLESLPKPLLILSTKAAEITSKVNLLPPVHPYDFMIEKELYDTIVKYYHDQGDDSTTRFKRCKQKSDDTIQPLIEKYYNCNEPNKQKTLRNYNRFSKSVYHDLHLIHDTHQRNVTRFILRNLIHLARRYVTTSFNRLRTQRNETTPIARITILPHIMSYTYNRIANQLGPVLVGQLSEAKLHPNVEQKALFNMLVCGLDRIWLPGQKPKDVEVTGQSSYCHSNCVCGRGFNATTS